MINARNLKCFLVDGRYNGVDKLFLNTCLDDVIDWIRNAFGYMPCHNLQRMNKFDHVFEVWFVHCIFPCGCGNVRLMLLYIGIQI